MHQAYFDRKLSQPTTISNPRSITPKPFSRIFEDSNRSPERLNSELSQGNTNSPAVNRSKYRNNTSSLGSSLKLSSKVREQVLYTDRSGNRVNQAYNYNAKNTYNHGMEPVRIKSERTQSVITKTEPNVDSDNVGQTAMLLQKISKMKSEMTYLQEKESLYLSKLTNLERENKSLQRLLEDKEVKIQEISQKANDDKAQIYQLLTELEAYKQSNLKQQYRFDSAGTACSTIRLSELCDSTRKGDKAISLDKCIQAIEASGSNPECSRCGNVTILCEHLMNRLNEVDQDSRIIIKEHNSMRELLLRARKAENDSLKARSEMEKKVTDLQTELDIQMKFLNEIVAENSSIRKILAEVVNPNLTVPSQDTSEMRKSWRGSFKTSSQKQMYPLPASMKALVGAEKVLKVMS